MVSIPSSGMSQYTRHTATPAPHRHSSSLSLHLEPQVLLHLHCLDQLSSPDSESVAPLVEVVHHWVAGPWGVCMWAKERIYVIHGNDTNIQNNHR